MLELFGQTFVYSLKILFAIFALMKFAEVVCCCNLTQTYVKSNGFSINNSMVLLMHEEKNKL
jgi:hypothetical protein